MAEIWSKYGIQFGVGVRGGCDTAVLKIQAELDADKYNVAILADISNAFNTRERYHIARELYAVQSTQPIWKLFRFAYQRSESPLIVYSRDGQCQHVQASANGVRQGDPLASLLFALSMDRLYQRAKEAAGPNLSVACVAVLD